jgi:PAS domain S-box-containing protein
MAFLEGLLTPPGLLGLAIGIAIAIATGFISVLYVKHLREQLRQRHHELAATARRNQALVEASAEGVLELDVAGTVRYANPAAARLLGYEVQELIGLDYRVLINAREATDATGRPQRIRFQTDIAREVGAILRRKDGQRRPIEYRIVPMAPGPGGAAGTVLTFSDVSERVRLDTLVRDMQRLARVGGWEYELATGKLTWTDLGFAAQELPVQQGMSVEQILRYVHPEDRERLQAAVKTVVQTGHQMDLELRVTLTQGREAWVRIIIKAEQREGKVVRLRGTFQDVTDRMQAERQVRETRDFYELTLDAIPVLVSYINADLYVTYANAPLLEWLRKPAERVIGQHLKDVIACPNVYVDCVNEMESVLRGEARVRTVSNLFDGRMRDAQVYFVPQMGSDGRTRGFFCIIVDISELKRLEQRLVQAQKMEAIGQLTDGIAHDFNNLLGVVLGNLQLLERSLADSPSLARKLNTAMRAVTRGADLTRRLLAFSRRQIVAPVVIDISQRLAGLVDLMRQTLGDAIEVCMQVAPDVWRTRVDAVQFENAILNLAINARDAMPEGGKLTVQAKNMHADTVFCAAHPPLKPGDYVCISVTDTGCGIPPDVLGRVFEPFFTTKGPGNGSGLGLAMVHRLAEQAGGVALIESTVGKGTTVRILLPRCEDEPVNREDTIVDKIAPRGTETILVVEDDADLRETVVTSLSQLGYRALPAANAEAALRVLSRPEHIDLLFTDVMMPGGMLGPALGQRARELRPRLKVLYTTGYAEQSVFSFGSGVSPADIIYKPYRTEDLAARIRSVLDREARVA